MNSDDQILVTKCLKGDKGSFEEIVEKYYKIIYRLAFRIMRDSDDAEEITQTVFVKAYENLGAYNPKFKFFSWLYRITLNESINLSKRKDFSEGLTEKQSTSEDNPEDIYDQSEISENIRNALMELDMLYRIPVVLKHFMDYSYKEIGHLLDIPEKTVKSRLFTGRQLLKDILVKKRIFQ